MLRFRVRERRHRCAYHQGELLPPTGLRWPARIPNAPVNALRSTTQVHPPVNSKTTGRAPPDALGRHGALSSYRFAESAAPTVVGDSVPTTVVSTVRGPSNELFA